MPQATIRTPSERSIRMDVKCRLGDGTYVNVEVQKGKDLDHFRRVRYNASLLTMSITIPGMEFGDIPDVKIVYITAFDPFKKGLSVYHSREMVMETGEIVENGMENIYVNSELLGIKIPSIKMPGIKTPAAPLETFPIPGGQEQQTPVRRTAKAHVPVQHTQFL